MTTQQEVNEALQEEQGILVTENSVELGGLLAVVDEEAIGQFFKAVRQNDFESDASRLNSDTLVAKIEIDQLDQMVEELDAEVSELEEENHTVEAPDQ